VVNGTGPAGFSKPEVYGCLADVIWYDGGGAVGLDFSRILCYIRAARIKFEQHAIEAVMRECGPNTIVGLLPTDVILTLLALHLTFIGRLHADGNRQQ
jgi:hypothetical protein